MSDLVFPMLRGVAWGTKLKPHHFYGSQVARSGREVRAQFASQPITHFSILYSDDGFLSEKEPKAADDGSVVYSDFETMLGFFNYHGGGFQSFLFQGVNAREKEKYSRNGELQFIGDGGMTIFQLVRNVGIWAESIFWPQGDPTVYVGGAKQDSANVVALGKGIYQLAAAPAAGVQVVADFTFAYRCTFDAAEVEFTNWADGYWQVETPIKTVKP